MHLVKEMVLALSSHVPIVAGESLLVSIGRVQHGQALEVRRGERKAQKGREATRGRERHRSQAQARGGGTMIGREVNRVGKREDRCINGTSMESMESIWGVHPAGAGLRGHRTQKARQRMQALCRGRQWMGHMQQWTQTHATVQAEALDHGRPGRQVELAQVTIIQEGEGRGGKIGPETEPTYAEGPNL